MSNIKILSLLFLVLCSHMPLVAQSDTAVMRISYDAKFKTCVERPAMKDEMELLIGNKWSKFYSSANIRQQHVLDSVVQATGGQLQQALAASTRMRGSGGTAWQNQQREFEDIPAPILFTTNCIMPLRASYADRAMRKRSRSWR